MTILQRYFAVSIAQAVAFVLAAFLALVAFNDLTAELAEVGKDGYMLQHALLYVALQVPRHVFEVMPVAALIGTIYTMANFASTSEYTIMRASGMSTRHAIWMLAKIGAVLVAITFVFGELITPRIAPFAETLKLNAKGAAISQDFKSGMWTKDVVRSEGTTGTVTGSRFFNVREIRPDGQLVQVRLYEFDTAFRMRTITAAASARFLGDSTWELQDVTETRFVNSAHAPAELPNFGQASSKVETEKFATRKLISEITPKILSVSVSASDPDRMSANELAVFTRHLAENKQQTDRFKIAFWKKLIDPLSILVLMMLALPFAYLHTRSGGVSLKIFIGIMIGVSFIILNTLFSHIGMLSSLPAFVTAIAPSLLFMLLALGALYWVERH